MIINGYCYIYIYTYLYVLTHMVIYVYTYSIHTCPDLILWSSLPIRCHHHSCIISSLKGGEVHLFGQENVLGGFDDPPAPWRWIMLDPLECTAGWSTAWLGLGFFGYITLQNAMQQYIYIYTYLYIIELLDVNWMNRSFNVWQIFTTKAEYGLKKLHR